MKNIYVLRHGTTELNKKKLLNAQIDEPLAPEGVVLAKKAITLIPKSVKYIYSSPMIRARQTAEIINEKRHLPLFFHEGLREINMGQFAGKSWTDLEQGAELKKKHRSLQFDYRSHGGEAVEEVKKRVREFLKEINNVHADNQVLLVTHGGIIRLLTLLEQEKILDEIENASLFHVDTNKILSNITK